jgi:hypothetical protein
MQIRKLDYISHLHAIGPSAASKDSFDIDHSHHTVSTSQCQYINPISHSQGKKSTYQAHVNKIHTATKKCPNNNTSADENTVLTMPHPSRSLQSPFFVLSCQVNREGTFTVRALAFSNS